MILNEEMKTFIFGQQFWIRRAENYIFLDAEGVIDGRARKRIDENAIRSMNLDRDHGVPLAN